MAGYRSAGFATILLFYDIPKTLYGQLSTPHFKKRTDYCTHHVPQKTICLNGKDPSRILHLSPFGMHYFA